MYFSRLRLHIDNIDPRKLTTFQGGGYREHQALWKLFDGDNNARRDFLFRRDDKSREPTYFVVSQRKPNDTSGYWHIEPKPYTPQLTKGQKLAFSLRINPVITRTDTNGRGKRHDLIMDQKKRLGWKELTPDQREPLPKLIQKAGEQWLNSHRQERLGIETNALRADGYSIHYSYKPKQEKRITYSTLDLQGILTVTDNEKLKKALFEGIGPAKAFGCGLLLVRRV